MEEETEYMLSLLKDDPESGYSRLYEENYGMVRHLVLHNNGVEADAKDVFQETIVALYEMTRRPSFSFSAKPGTLIYSIARNLWLKQLRGRGVTVELRDFETPIQVEEYDSETDDLIVKMERAIVNLGQPCQGILTSFYYLKKSMSDIAAEYGYRSASHTKTQKYKCLQRLKRAATWK